VVAFFQSTAQKQARAGQKEMDRQPDIERISASEAMSRARSNGLRRYPSPERDGTRLYPLASPDVRPSFEIGPDDTIFAIGSCFARNVEKSLEAAGKRVLSRVFELGEIGESLGDAANFFNKYSIHSVTNEIRWAVERETFPGEALIYPLGKGRYCDSQLGMAKLEFPMEEILAFRHRYLDAMAQVLDADVVIVTLGYVETWYDRELDLFLNVSPPAPLIKAFPDRFEFRVLSYQQIMDGLEELYQLLLKHRKKPLKMLVTVSPVPLLSTFRDMDVLVANAYSKSVQRAALDEFTRDKAGVDYFPSYEFVTLSNPKIAWSRGDYRHVSPDVVNRIMAAVLEAYVQGGNTEGAATREGLISSVKQLHQLDEQEAILALLGDHPHLVEEDGQLLMSKAAALRRLGRLDEAWESLSQAVEVAPERPLALERLITLTRPLKKLEEGRALLEQHRQRFPRRNPFRERIDWL
jgi:tetratricopeptide (TPR) repeat protein